MLTLCAGLIPRMNKYKLAVACCAKATFELTEEKRRYAAGRRDVLKKQIHTTYNQLLVLLNCWLRLAMYDVMAGDLEFWSTLFGTSNYLRQCVTI